MKKKYIRPQAFFESYELSQHVAACGWDVNAENENVCFAEWDPDLTNTTGQGVGFTFDRGCEWILEGPGQNVFDYCYTNGASDSAKLFRS